MICRERERETQDEKIGGVTEEKRGMMTKERVDGGGLWSLWVMGHDWPQPHTHTRTHPHTLLVRGLAGCC